MSNVLDSAKKRKNILVISSQVIRGSVGNRVNVYVLEQLGFSVWAMPTVIMPWQPRQGPSHKLPVSVQDFTAWADDIAASPKALELDAVITGYFVAPEQVKIAADLIKKLKTKKPELLFLCDPIMGNENGPYVPQTVMEAICKILVPLANLVKPNRNELEWICGQKFHNNAEIIAAIKAHFSVPFFVSSAFSQPIKTGSAADAAGKAEEQEAAELMGNLYYDGKEIWLAEHSAFKTVLNGFGDVIAALFLFYFIQGASAKDIAGKTTAAVYEYLCRTLQCGADELALGQVGFNPAAPNKIVELQKLF